MAQNITTNPQSSNNNALANVSNNALERLIVLTQTDMEKVNSLIISRAHSHVDMVPELANYLIGSGGKRLRPMLTIACAKMFANPNENESNKSQYFAAAVEFMHNATLLHDDVVDESNMRRNKPAARIIWGNQASVLVGDFLLGQAFLMMVETKDIDALGILSKAATIIAEGEVFQLSKIKDLNTSAQEYDMVIRSKTGALFEAATKVGAMAGGADAASYEALGIYGLELGRAFQLSDDALDYGGAKGVFGKNTGDDLREGKMSLPIILLLENANDKEKALIVSALGNQDCDDLIVEKIIGLMKEKKILEQVMQQASNSVANAKKALEILPSGEIVDALFDIADFCLVREY